MTGPIRERRIITYDLEWVPGPGPLRLRTCGVWDGERFRSYRTVRAFLDNELVHSNRGAWFFAHNAGRADMNFLLEEIANRPEYSARIAFSGSSAFIVKVQRGHGTWTFADSLWLLKSSLAEIGKWMNHPKTGPDEDMTDDERRDWYATVPQSELEEYNRNDCVLLYDALKEFERRVNSYGGELMLTLASTAMRLFRRKYLHHIITPSKFVNHMAQDAYAASRVEVHSRYARNGRYYDINSSFPASMRIALPGNALEMYSGRTPKDSAIYMARATVEVPECYLPPVPVRRGGRVFFPTGKWSGTFSHIDLQMIEDYGGKIHEIHDIVEFEPFHDLRSFAETLYEQRRISTDPVDKMALKLLLNSLYGKFAEKEDKIQGYINPPMNILEHLPKENQIILGVFFRMVKIPIHHAHVPLSMAITANSRKLLTDHLRTAGEGHFHYCDTDGFSTDRIFATSDRLGDLKEELRFKSAEYINAKTYCIDGKVKAKGMSLSRNQEERLRQFDLLKKGEEIEAHRMIRVRENLTRYGSLRPHEEVIRKGLSEKAFPKRYTFRDGTTRPWTIRELEKRFGKK